MKTKAKLSRTKQNIIFVSRIHMCIYIFLHRHMYTHTTLHAHNQTNDAVLYVYLIQVVACLRFKLSDVWDLSVIFWVVGLKKTKGDQISSRGDPSISGIS